MSAWSSFWRKVGNFFRKLFGGGGDTPDPVPDPTPGPAPDPVPPADPVLRASFLFDGARTRVMNILSAGCSDKEFDAVLTRCLKNGDNSIYLALANRGDGPSNWNSTTFYKSDFAGDVDNGKAQAIADRLAYCLGQKGLRIDAWMVLDDSSKWIPYGNVAKLKAHQANVVRLFDRYIARYCVGLEIDTTIKSLSAVGELVAHLKGLTKKPVGIHLSHVDLWDWATRSGADLFYGQYKFGHSSSEIGRMTRDTIARLGSRCKLIAAEYNRDSDSATAKAQGRAALAAGAIGYGTGG